MLRKLGPQEPRKYKYHFKSMTTVGEPIEPEAWRWYYDEVGKREAVITDTWWMTETGGFLGTTMPAIHAMRSEEHTSELQSLAYLVCRLLLEKKKKKEDCLQTQ